MPTSPRVLGAVALGGAAGAVLRFTAGELVPDGTGYAWTTFAINVLGSVLLALLPAVAVVRRHRLLTAGLGPGLLGGFTTLSAASEQTRALLGDDRPVLAGLYLLGTLAACLVGVALASALSSPAAQESYADQEGDE